MEEHVRCGGHCENFTYGYPFCMQLTKLLYVYNSTRTTCVQLAQSSALIILFCCVPDLTVKYTPFKIKFETYH